MHQKHILQEPDEFFDSGTLAYLVAGNEGRVLDGRRTPGFIESYDEESAMFVWRITGFEDAGQYWEIPADQIGSYQLRKGSKTRSNAEVEAIRRRCDELNVVLIIEASQEAKNSTEKELEQWGQSATLWLAKNSAFFRSGEILDFSAKTGSELLAQDLINYMKSLGLDELEKETAQQYLLNPYSGEWIKGMKLVMAEMGLMPYQGTKPRKPDIFQGNGAKEKRRSYILARMSFLSAVFKLCGIKEVPLYRGMSTEENFFETPRTLLSTTFSLETAIDYADLKQDSSSRSAFVIKLTCPIERIFMTYLETKALNERYKEQEAVIFYDQQVKF